METTTGRAWRLQVAVRDRASRLRTAAAVDLALVDALLGSDDPEDAVAALAAVEGHRQALQALTEDLHAVLAGATVERDATAS